MEWQLYLFNHHPVQGVPGGAIRVRKVPDAEYSACLDYDLIVLGIIGIETDFVKDLPTHAHTHKTEIRGGDNRLTDDNISSRSWLRNQ